MKRKELKKLSEQERKGKMVELYKELMQLRAQARGSTPKSPGMIKSIKRTIAQLKTPLHVPVQPKTVKPAQSKPQPKQAEAKKQQ